jgi:acyl carrier protein
LADRLRAALAQRLPAYMVPAAFVVLPGLPLTASGKVDRRALPAPEWRGEVHVAPRTPLEEVLASFWQEMLGAERVGVHDSFFQLGGHSLQATRLIARVRTVFAVEIPVRRLFQTPILEALAQEIQAAESTPGRSEKIARALLKLKARKQ